MEMSKLNPLDDALRRLEALSFEFDAGDSSASTRIAEVLRDLFSTTLTRLSATYARITSSVPKPPYPQTAFFPLLNVSVTLNAFETQVVSTTITPPAPTSIPVFKPHLGAIREFRQVQAPDWWKNEPIFIIDNSRITRRDLSLWAVSRNGAIPEGQKLPALYDRLRRGQPVIAHIPLRNGATLDAPLLDAQPSALRQLAYEVLRSPELLKLAGRVKP